MNGVNVLDTLVHPEFYELIDYYQPQEEELLDVVKAMLPDAWQYFRNGVWFGCKSPVEDVRPLPGQGWKIHVSSSTENAADTLKIVVPILRDHGVSFKFALDLRILTFMNGKSWVRQGAAKFITIYPVDEEHFKFLIELLYQATGHLHGPYILSDRRYKDSKVVFYRYGGIKPYGFLTVKGEKTHVLMSPSGERVPDQRLPYFFVPEWTKDPFEEASETGARPKLEPDKLTLKDGRYLVKRVLSFSNSGGVYVAEDQETGQEVVIKEARPFITTTEDAIMLLKKEHKILTKLAHTGIAPRPLDFFQDWEHYYLVQEYILGMSLSDYSARNNVVLFTRPSIADAEKFYHTFKTIFLQLTNILQVMHDNGIVFSDLSPNNVVVLKDSLDIKIIDFEGAFEIGEDAPIMLYTPGFAYADQMQGLPSTFASDYFAMGAIMHFFLTPVNQMWMIHPRSRYTFVRSITKDIGFPQSIADLISALIDKEAGKRPLPSQVIEVLQRDEPVSTPNFSHEGTEADPTYQSYVKGIVEYILGVATFDRRDRLFPADSKVFGTNPLSLSYGACGVAYAINRMEKQVPDSVLNWILERNKHRDLYPPGLYVGLSGIAWGMLEIGLHKEAREVLHSTHDHPMLYDSFDVYFGAAGWGLANLKFFTEFQDEIYLRKAEDAGEFLLRTLEEDERGCFWKENGEIPLGYGYGASGVSMFLLYLYLASGKEKYLDVGIRAMDFDISHGSPNLEDGLSWRRVADKGSIVYPYWQFGAAGVGMAALRYYKLLGEEKYKDVLEKIYIETDRKYAVFPGFRLGLSGLGEFLLDMHLFTKESRYLDSAYKVAAGVSLFKIEKKQGLAFPGDMLRRISCDYLTGSAGIGHFFHRLVSREEGAFNLDELFMTAPQTELAGSY
jgi:serine/threonine protein kinase